MTCCFFSEDLGFGRLVETCAEVAVGLSGKLAADAGCEGLIRVDVIDAYEVIFHEDFAFFW